MIYHDLSLYFSGVLMFSSNENCSGGRGRAALLVRPRWLGCGLQRKDTKLDPLTACLGDVWWLGMLGDVQMCINMYIYIYVYIYMYSD